MRVLVKICGLREERHVVDALDAGADALGFVFAASARQITPQKACTISKHVPLGVKRVAVMLHPGNDEWLAVLEHFRPDVLQTDAEDLAALDIPDGLECWPVFREGSDIVGTGSTYLYEGAKSGQGETVNWSAAADVARHGNMVLAGGLRPDNVATAIQTVKPYGVDASSGLESAPGQKDSRLIREFVRAVRAVEKNV
ncbi:MAG: phosphoribosylanthranilate isomerase [Woeseiaceae bacterium]